MVYNNALIKIFISYFSITFIYSKCSSKEKSQKGKKCSGVNKNNDTGQNGEKDNNEEEQNKDEKKTDPYEAKKKELIDRLDKLNVENKSLTLPIKKDFDTLKNKINDIKSNDDVTLIEFDLLEFETSINNAKEKQEAENGKIKKIKKKNEELKKKLINLTGSDDYSKMKSTDLRSTLNKTLEDNYEDGFSEDNIDADNNDLIGKIKEHITAIEIKEIEEENKNKSEKELENELTNLLNGFEINNKDKNSSYMQDSLNSILNAQCYKKILGKEEIKELVKKIGQIIEVKNEEEKKAKKKKEDEERKKKEIEDKNKNLKDSLTQLANTDANSSKLEDTLNCILDGYKEDNFITNKLDDVNKKLLEEIEQKINNKKKEEEKAKEEEEKRKKEEEDKKKEEDEKNKKVKEEEAKSNKEAEIKEKNEQLRQLLTGFNTEKKDISIESDAFENFLKKKFKEDFLNIGLNQENKELLGNIRKYIKDEESNKKKGTNKGKGTNKWKGTNKGKGDSCIVL